MPAKRSPTLCTPTVRRAVHVLRAQHGEFSIERASRRAARVDRRLDLLDVVRGDLSEHGRLAPLGELLRVAAVLLERLKMAEDRRLVAGRRGGRADKIDRDAARAHARARRGGYVYDVGTGVRRSPPRCPLTGARAAGRTDFVVKQTRSLPLSELSRRRRNARIAAVAGACRCDRGTRG